MQMHQLTSGSLVLYKIRPARVLAIADKIEIELEDGKTKRVRGKDVKLLHPGPLQSLRDLPPLSGDLDETWELLAGSETNLPELAELIYGRYAPDTAWAAWQLVADGLLFEGTPERITARTPALVALDRAEREAKAVAEQEWLSFLERLNERRIIPQDRERLAEVERLAHKQSKVSRILKILGYQEKPENAHRLLLELGYWESTFNPHPGRIGVQLETPGLAVPSLPEEERLDLTHLPAFAIDDEGNRDPDDAISLDGDRIWVHVADVAALVVPDSELDLEARARSATLYLPETTVPMLPWQLTEQLGLGLSEISPALSFGFRMTPEGTLCDIEVARSWVRVTRLSYAAADKCLHESPFNQLLELCGRFRERRHAAGAIRLDLPEVSVRMQDDEVLIRPMPRIQSRELVTDAMLMAGEAAARYAQERDIPIPYATQPPPEVPVATDGLAAMYASRRLLKPSQSKCQPGSHAGLGLDLYSRATSPLRRYLDLVTHQQLRRHLAGMEPLPIETLVERVGAADAVGGGLRRVERLSNLHWKLVYLDRNPDWQGSGIVVEMLDQRATLLIPELAMEAKVRLRGPVELDTELKLALREIDLADQIARFRVLGGG